MTGNACMSWTSRDAGTKATTMSPQWGARKWSLALGALVLCLVASPRAALPQPTDLPAEIVVQAGHAKVNAIVPLSGTERYLTGSPDGTVKVADREGVVWRTIPVCDFWIHSLAVISPTLMAAGCGDHNIYLHDVESGAQIRTLKGKFTAKELLLSSDRRWLFAIAGSERQVYDLLSPDNVPVAGAGPAVGAVPAVESQEPLSVRPDSHGLLRASVRGGAVDFALPKPGIRIDSLSWAPDGFLALGLASGEVQLWDMQTGIPIQTLPTHKGPIHSLAYIDNGLALISAGFDDTVRSHDFRNGTSATLFEIRSAGESGGRDDWGNIVENLRRDIDHRPQLRAPTGLRRDDAPRPNTDELYRVSVSPDGRFIAASGRGRYVFLKERGPKAKVNFFTGESAEEKSDIVEIPSSSFSADGSKLAVLYPKRVRVYGTATGSVEQEIPLDGVAQVVAMVGRTEPVVAVGFRSGDVRGWRVRDRTQVFSGKGPGSVNALCWWPQGNVLVSAGSDGTIVLWDVDGKKEARVLRAQSTTVSALNVHPAKPYLASAGSDGSVRIWNLESEVLLGTLIAATEGDWVVADQDGFFDGPTASWERVRYRIRDRLFAPEQFAKVFWEPGMLAEVYSSGKSISALLRERGDKRLGASVGDLARATPPSVEIRLTDPKTAGRRFQEIEISVAGKGAGARDLRVFRGGSLVYREDGPVSPSQKITRKMTAGQNRISAYAFSDAGTRSTIATSLANGPAAPPAATLWVAAIGIDNYAEKPLNYAVSDARAVIETFRSLSEGRYGRIELIPLLDANAKKNIIAEKFGMVARQSEPEDVFIFSFSGHGMRISDRLHLLPYDYGDGPGGKLDPRTISDEELQAWLAPIQASRILLIIDACHSGQALEASDSRWGPMNARGLGQLAFEKGIYFVGASQGYQAALENMKYGHGLLTYALVQEGLLDMKADDRPPDGRVSAEELLSYVEGRVPKLQLDKTAARNLGYRPPQGGVNPDSSPVQRPRVFYPRDLGREPLLLRERQPSSGVP